MASDNLICPIMHTFVEQAGKDGPELIPVTARCVKGSCAWWDSELEQCSIRTIGQCMVHQSYAQDDEEDDEEDEYDDEDGDDLDDGEDGDEDPEPPIPPTEGTAKVIELLNSTEEPAHAPAQG